MSKVDFERLFVLDEDGQEFQLFRATLDGQETFGRDRAQCLEQLAWQLRRLQGPRAAQREEPTPSRIAGDRETRRPRSPGVTEQGNQSDGCEPDGRPRKDT